VALAVVAWSRIPWLRSRSKPAFQARYCPNCAPRTATIGLCDQRDECKTSHPCCATADAYVTRMVSDNAANEPYTSWVRTMGAQWDTFFSFDSAIKDQIPADLVRECMCCIRRYPRRLTRFRSPMRIVRGMDVTYAYWCAIPGSRGTSGATSRFGCPYLGLVWLEADQSASALARTARMPKNPQSLCLAKICINTNILPIARG